MKVFLCAGLVCLAAGVLAAPPKVAFSMPTNSSTDVDPRLKELRVVFDQPMSQGGMSVVGGGPKFPKLVGKARWEDERTFVWSWQLEPARDYWLSINSDRFQNFRNTAGEAAVPHPISFRTRDDKSGPVSTRERNADAIDHLKRAITQDYSYHDLRKVDWPHRFAEFSSKLEAAGSPREFAETAAQLLEPAQDIHLWLKVDAQTIPTFRRSAFWNVSLSSLPKLVPQWRQHNDTVSTGLFEDGTRYLFLRSWPNTPADLDPAFEQIANAASAGKPLLVDVRANGGGSETTAQALAGCFVQRSMPYAKHATRSGGKFSEPYTRSLQPNSTRPAFTNRVVVLAGKGTISSSEAFVEMMKQNPRCTVVGENTAGSSGNPLPIDLGNGVTAFVPSWKNLSLDGASIEGIGVKPDVELKTQASDFAESDPVLKKGLEILRKGPSRP